MCWTDDELYMMAEEEILDSLLEVALRNDPDNLACEAEERAKAKAKAWTRTTKTAL